MPQRFIPVFGRTIRPGAPLRSIINATARQSLPDSILWMPMGTHNLSARQMDGGTWDDAVVCDEIASIAVQADFVAATIDGRRTYIDFNHDDGEASAWVQGFSWDPARGIVAKVEWTAKGAEALIGKSFYSFSPTFRVNKASKRVAGLVRGHAAGGLVNAPAFGAAMPALLSARGRSAAADLVSRMLVARGHSKTKADEVADLIDDGHSDGRAILDFIKLISHR